MPLMVSVQYNVLPRGSNTRSPNSEISLTIGLDVSSERVLANTHTLILAPDWLSEAR